MSSILSTIRVWDVEEASKKQLHVIKSRSKQGTHTHTHTRLATMYIVIILIGKKTPILTCCYSKDGKYVAGAQGDGSIALWKGDGPYVSVFFIKILYYTQVFKYF